MKKGLKIALIVIFIIGIFSLCGIFIYSNLSNYSNTLKINWNIRLSKDSIKEIYKANSSLSFHGDGIRYHVFAYENEDEIKKLFVWSTEEKETIFYSSYSESINNWLNKIKASKNYYPNYSNCKYWYNTKDDNSEIIILWDSEENKLYVVESFV